MITIRFRRKNGTKCYNEHELALLTEFFEDMCKSMWSEVCPRNKHCDRCMHKNLCRDMVSAVQSLNAPPKSH